MPKWPVDYSDTFISSLHRDFPCILFAINRFLLPHEPRYYSKFAAVKRMIYTIPEEMKTSRTNPTKKWIDDILESILVE